MNEFASIVGWIVIFTGAMGIGLIGLAIFTDWSIRMAWSIVWWAKPGGRVWFERNYTGDTGRKVKLHFIGIMGHTWGFGVIRHEAMPAPTTSEFPKEPTNEQS